MFNPAYDVPRSAPLPTSVGKHALSPSVPEISMILNNPPQGKLNFQNSNNKENVPRFGVQNKFLNHMDMQKQVRFHSPTEVERRPVVKNVLPDKTNILPENRTKFTDVYMANVPNRHLDLSMIDNHSVKNFSTNCFAAQNCSQQKRDDSIADLAASNKQFNFHSFATEQNQKSKLGVSNIHDYKSSNDEVFSNTRSFQAEMPKNEPTLALEKRRDVADDWGKVSIKNSNEPTVNDLLKIIQQQNEQLLILQKQVSHLIEYQAAQSQRPIAAGSHVTDYYCQRQTNVFGDVLTTEKREEFKPPTLNKGPLSKFAIDVTTSFEVSVRRQQNAEQRNKFQEKKIQEITENSPLKSMGDSLLLNNQLPVREDCPSPVNSIHVDMNDYSSESDDDSSCSSSNIDWTLYNNIMEQVNHILRKAQKSSDDEVKSEGSYKNETMKKVMEATVKHLKSVGINLATPSNPENVQRLTEDTKNYTSTEISFAVKQLLMKYLPPEHLAKVVCTKNSSSSSGSSEEMADLVKKRPEFSFATLQYMKKYNLMRSDETGQGRQVDHVSNRMLKQGNNNNKILDITALKQQPKLL